MAPALRTVVAVVAVVSLIALAGCGQPGDADEEETTAVGTDAPTDDAFGAEPRPANGTLVGTDGTPTATESGLDTEADGTQ